MTTNGEIKTEEQPREDSPKRDASPPPSDSPRRKEEKEKSKKKRRRSSSSSSRSRSRSKSRSRSRDRKRSRRSRTRSHTFSRSPSPVTSKRLHIGNLDESVRRRDVEETFGKFGKLEDIWVASYPPFYAFVVYEKGSEAADALKEMRNGYVGRCRIRTTIALPRHSARRGPPPERRSYGGYGRDRGFSPRRRSRSPRRSRRSRSRSRSRSRDRGRKSRRSASRSRSRSSSR